MRNLFFAAATALASTSFASANDFAPAMQNYLEASISTWTSNPVLVEALKTQNSKTAAYSQADIDTMDQQWRAQVGSSDAPLVEQVLSNEAAEFLRSQVEISGGAITEVFIMDARGLNVAASAPTSDMWQGDEAKFTETFPKGEGAAHFSDVEFDESTQRYQGQISVSVVDPDSGDVVGAITVGVDAEALL